MTGRTHDLIALSAVNIIIATQPLPPMSIATLITCISATMIGGIIPDIDQPTSKLWNQIPTGFILGRLIHPLLGSHRLITHSILGFVLFGYALPTVLNFISQYLIVDMRMIWWAIMIGYFSHLIADSLTTEGVPWLFPLPIRFGFPPLKSLRIKTGGIIEKAIIFPGLIVTDIYLIYTYYPQYIAFFRNITR